MIKVLFVTYDFPYPLNSGGKNRAYNMIKYGKKDDISVDLLSYVREDFDLKNIEEIKKIGVKDVEIYERKKLKSAMTIGLNLISKNSIFKTLYSDRGFFNVLKKMIRENKIDIVHFESSYVGYFIGEELRKMGVLQILGTENIEHMLYRDFLSRSKNIIKKSVLSYQVERFKKEEENMMKGADECIAVTRDEANYITGVTNKKCKVIANAVSLKDFKFKFSNKTRDNILLVGNFTYMPNVSALKYFINKVLPLIDKNITLTIIGKRVNDYAKRTKQIVTLGYVDDLIGEYRKADLMVFPIKMGGGTNYKILEAMALGVPVVAFPDKLSSIGAKEDIDYFGVRNEHEFAEKIGNIVRNKKQAYVVVKHARALIEESYSWEMVGDKLSKIWEDLKNEKK